MRGLDTRLGELFSYIDLEQRVPAKHPLRKIRQLVNDVLVSLDAEFAKLSAFGRESIPPERLLRALLLQALFTIRSERQLMEQLDYNLLFRWFVGLGIDDPVWVPTVFTKNATGCSMPTWRRSSWSGCSRTRRFASCCRTSISRSMAR
jgi:transposase